MTSCGVLLLSASRGGLSHQSRRALVGASGGRCLGVGPTGCQDIGTSRAIALHIPKRYLFQSNKLASTARTSPQNNKDLNQSLPPHVDSHLSYAYGRSFNGFQYVTLGKLIEDRAKQEPHSTAAVVYDEGISKSFEQLNADINRLVNGMVQELDLKQGDNVGLYSYNTYQSLVIQFACNKLGLKFNPINPSYKFHEFSYVLSKADVKVLFLPGKNSKQAPLNDHHSVICDKAFAGLQAKGMFADLRNVILLDGDLDAADLSFKNVTVRRWRSILSSNAELEPEAARRADLVSPDDIYGIYYTSGTTGFPKGAAVTQFNVINNNALACERVFNQRGPRFHRLRPNVCLPLPLFHEFAGVLGVLLPFTIGGSFVFPGMRYSIQSVVESILRFKCNSIFLTPTILIDLLGYVSQNKLHNLPLRTILIAGSSVVPDLVQKTHKLLPELEEFRIGYGSSENGVIATMQTSQEPDDTKAYTVGPPLDHSEVRIADTNTNQTTPLGQSGEVQTRGFNTMQWYYNDMDKTNEVITKARWYKTGDLGIIDHDGRLQIVGRIKDLILKGGENIYPAEVETVLHTHPAIEDAHVFGVPDKRFGEEVCTWVKLAPQGEAQTGAAASLTSSRGEEEELRKSIIGFCKERLTYFKVPKYVIFVTEFPVTPVKKIKKFEMRAKTVEMLGLEKH